MEDTGFNGFSICNYYTHPLLHRYINRYMRTEDMSMGKHIESGFRVLRMIYLYLEENTILGHCQFGPYVLTASNLINVVFLHFLDNQAQKSKPFSNSNRHMYQLSN